MNQQIELLETIPNTLYKYRTWEECHHKRIITHNELFFAGMQIMLALNRQIKRFPRTEPKLL